MTTKQDLPADGEPVALRTLNGKYYFVLCGEIRAGNKTTIRIDNAWKWESLSTNTRRITEELKNAGRETAVISDNEVTLTQCRHDCRLCPCRFGEIQAVETGALVDPYAVVPEAPQSPYEGGKCCPRTHLWEEA